MSDGTGLPEAEDRAGCARCPDGHTDPRTKPWGTRWVGRVGQDSPIIVSDAVVVSRSDGGHVSQADADWLWWLTRMAPFVSGEHWPKTVRQAEYSREVLGVRRVVTCACGHRAEVYGPAQLVVWYHAHNLWPYLTGAELAAHLARVSQDL